MFTSRKIPIGTIVIFGFFLITMVAAYFLTKPSPPPAELAGVLRPDFKQQLQPFKLTDHNNSAFTEKNFLGKWSFVFFGFTNCPHVCPTALNILNSIHGLLVEEAGKIPDDMQVVFISVDPDRDTIKRLAEYIPNFNKDFIGTRANLKEIDKIAKQFGSGYVKDKETTSGEYDIAHTSAFFLVDPYGRVVATFSQPQIPSTITSQYKKIRKYFSWD
jgi:protein SCO1/2